MNRSTLERLGEAQDFGELASALVAECECHGRIHSLHLTHNKRAGRVSCVIEMDTLHQQLALKRSLGATGTDGSAYLEIPVSAHFALPDPVAAFPADPDHAYLPGGSAHPLTA